MNKVLSIASIVLVFVSCKTKSQVIEVARNEDAIKYATTITASDLEKHLSIIASDEYEGRETGMPGQKKAAKYIEDYYKSIGVKGGMLDASYQQSFPLILKDPKNIEISTSYSAMIIEPDSGEEMMGEHTTILEFLADYYYFGGFSDTLLKDKEFVFVGYGIDESNYNSYTSDVTGKVVIMFEGQPEGVNLKKDWDNWRLKLQTAQDKGAVATFSIKDEYETHAERIRYYIENPQMQLHNKGIKKYNRIPNFFIPARVAENFMSSTIEEMQASAAKKEVLSLPETAPSERITIHSYMTRTDITSENILGFIEGTDKKDEVLVISAHYDHIGYDNGEICNGADDDGSGTVGVLEIAQAFAQAKADGKGPRRSILFLNVSGEEKGLLGSQYYSENPIYTLESTITNLNVDMIGRVDDLHEDENYIYIIGADKLSNDLHQISEGCNKTYSQLELDYTYNNDNDPNRFYYRSDHYNFAKNDIPVIFYFSGVHEDYHKPTDDVEKIMFPKMERVVRLIFHTAWELANTEERPALNKN